MKQNYSRWNLFCINCSFAYTKVASEAEAICQRCGGTLTVSEITAIKELKAINYDPKSHNTRP